MDQAIVNGGWLVTSVVRNYGHGNHGNYLITRKDGTTFRSVVRQSNWDAYWKQSALALGRNNE